MLISLTHEELVAALSSYLNAPVMSMSFSRTRQGDRPVTAVIEVPYIAAAASTPGVLGNTVTLDGYATADPAANWRETPALAAGGAAPLLDPLDVSL